MSALVKRKCKCGGNQHEWYKIVEGKRAPFWICFHCGKREMNPHIIIEENFLNNEETK